MSKVEIGPSSHLLNYHLFRCYCQDLFSPNFLCCYVFKSDAFSEGERAESPVAIGEKLSREGSPVQDVEYTQRPYSPAQLRPETPEQPGNN